MVSNGNYINHIALVLDASGSMMQHTKTVVDVADAFINRLASRSTELDQETRITVYTFNNTVTCQIFDKDALRLPSLRGLYRPSGGTALLDGMTKAVDDLRQTATMYGDHSFLTYGLTDGYENASKTKPDQMRKYLEGLINNETVALFVPDQEGVFQAKGYGFPADNIAIWSTVDAQGVEDVGRRIYETTDNYMRARSTGLRGTTQLFTLAAKDIKAAVKAGQLEALKPGQFRLLNVAFNSMISQFVETQTNRPYKLGEAYYQLTKREEIQPQKDIAIFDRKAYAVYHGKAARQMLGLPDMYVKVSPIDHPEYDIFVQSTSVNRKLVPGTKLLLLS